MKRIFLLTVFTVLTASVGLAQSEILVGGNPPLTHAGFESVAEYYERGLNIEFSAEERGRLREILVKNWRLTQKTNPQSLSGWLTTVAKINAIGGSKREAIREEIRDAVLGDLRASAGTDLSRFVLAVYENRETAAARTEDADAAENEPPAAEREDEARSETTDDFRPAAGTVRLSDLAGRWVKGTVASYGYRSAVTNDYRSGYGAANQHDIYADGRFDYTNYAQVSSYGCTTELSTSMKGRVSVSGPQVTFTYVSGTVKGKDSCKSSGFTKPAQIEKTTFRLERDKNRLRLCQIGAETPYCLYKVEE